MSLEDYKAKVNEFHRDHIEGKFKTVKESDPDEKALTGTMVQDGGPRSGQPAFIGEMIAMPTGNHPFGAYDQIAMPTGHYQFTPGPMFAQGVHPITHNNYYTGYRPSRALCKECGMPNRDAANCPNRITPGPTGGHYGPQGGGNHGNGGNFGQQGGGSYGPHDGGNYGPQGGNNNYGNGGHYGQHGSGNGGANAGQGRTNGNQGGNDGGNYRPQAGGKGGGNGGGRQFGPGRSGGWGCGQRGHARETVRTLDTAPMATTMAPEAVNLRERQLMAPWTHLTAR